MDQPVSARQSIVFSSNLLSDGRGGLDWPGLEALASQLSQSPEGWRAVAECFADYQRRSLSNLELDEITWLKAPTLLSLIGCQSDEATRLLIATEMIAAMDRYDMYHDFGHEVLLYATLHLGPSIMPVVLTQSRKAAPQGAGWFSLLGLIDLAVHPDASAAEQALGIEACESLLRRGIDGEIAFHDIECVGYPLAALGHTPSVGLIQQAAALWEKQTKSSGTRFGGLNELRHAYRVLAGQETLDHEPGDLGRLRDGLEPLIRHYWEQDQAYKADQEQRRQQAFEERVMAMEGYLPPIDEPDVFLDRPAPRKVGRNEPCPCGSAKKYKKCCGIKRR